MTVPKGWVRVQADNAAVMVYRSPSGAQAIRIEPVGLDASLTGDEGVGQVRKVLAKLPFAKTVCAGTQPAIFATGQNAKHQTVMEQVLVMGDSGGFVITYQIADGHPDPKAESAIRSICV